MLANPRAMRLEAMEETSGRCERERNEMAVTARDTVRPLPLEAGDSTVRKKQAAKARNHLPNALRNII